MPCSAELGGADRGQVDVMLTGTWLESEKLLAGLFFLLLLLLLLPPPELTVLPPETFLFRRLFGGCLAGSATSSRREEICLRIKYLDIYIISSFLARSCHAIATGFVCRVLHRLCDQCHWQFQRCVRVCGCVLPGGATILCHFWKRQVFRQSLGLKL